MPFSHKRPPQINNPKSEGYYVLWGHSIKKNGLQHHDSACPPLHKYYLYNQLHSLV